MFKLLKEFLKEYFLWRREVKDYLKSHSTMDGMEYRNWLLKNIILEKIYDKLRIKDD